MRNKLFHYRKLILALLFLCLPAFAARDFDGTNDNIVFGSDASIDGFVSQTVSVWLRADTLPPGAYFFLGKAASTQWQYIITALTNKIRFRHQWSTNGGVWEAGTVWTAGKVAHVAFTYNGSSTANDAVMYLNGASETVTEISTPSGTLTDDSAQNLRAGEDSGAGSDFDGLQMCLAYDNTIWSAAQINRARWWGRPGGAVKVYHPFFTTKLANEGTATADGTASGTTVVGFAVPVVRPGTALMGAMVGW